MLYPISCFVQKQLFGRPANPLVRFMGLDLGLERAGIIILEFVLQSYPILENRV